MITITLSPIQESRLEQEAQKAGVTVDELVLRTLQEKFPLDFDEDARALQLIEHWLAEAPNDPVEKKAAEDDQASFERSINQTRNEAGSRILYPNAR